MKPRRPNPVAREIVASALQDFMWAQTDTFNAMREQCESPIEELFLGGLMAASLRHGDCIEFSEGGLLAGAVPLRPTCYQQVRMGDYRVDFFIIKPSPKGVTNIVVECDGHEFHAVSKEQMARDRKRDRYFTSAGYVVLRFTGSEIFADPYHCGYEVVKMAVLSEGER